MNTPKHSLNIEQAHHDTYTPTTAREHHIVPGYLREKIARAAGERIVREAVEHRTIDLTTFTPQETIFPNITTQEQLPQTD
jgi:hypothetical protein